MSQLQLVFISGTFRFFGTESFWIENEERTEGNFLFFPKFLRISREFSRFSEFQENSKMLVACFSSYSKFLEPINTKFLDCFQKSNCRNCGFGEKFLEKMNRNFEPNRLVSVGCAGSVVLSRWCMTWHSCAQRVLNMLLITSICDVGRNSDDCHFKKKELVVVIDTV